MSEYMETIKHSMRQTEDCQAMANKLMKWCHELVEYIKILEKENGELKEKLNTSGFKEK